MTARSNRIEVRNPVIALPAMQELRALEPDIRAKVRALFVQLRTQALAKAEQSMAANKYVMFAYWRCWSVYFNHIGRALK